MQPLPFSQRMAELERIADKCFTKRGKPNINIIKGLVEEIKNSWYSSHIQELERGYVNFYKIVSLLRGGE